MRLLRRAKLRFHAQMHPHARAFKPAPTTFDKLRRLGDLRHPQQGGIKLACGVLFAYRHGELDVINGSK
jgi:hypothetical protein